jgi:hypothetical protein
MVSAGDDDTESNGSTHRRVEQFHLRGGSLPTQLLAESERGGSQVEREECGRHAEKRHGHRRARDTGGDDARDEQATTDSDRQLAADPESEPQHEHTGQRSPQRDRGVRAQDRRRQPCEKGECAAQMRWRAVDRSDARVRVSAHRVALSRLSISSSGVPGAQSSTGTPVCLRSVTSSRRRVRSSRWLGVPVTVGSGLTTVTG